MDGWAGKWKMRNVGCCCMCTLNNFHRVGVARTRVCVCGQDLLIFISLRRAFD